MIVLPAAYLPNVEYVHRLLDGETIIGGNETFPKQTYRNRCVIVNANGLQNLTVPVERQAALTKDIRISYAEDWEKNHLRSIESAYRRTPYYEYYIDSIESIIRQKHTYLVDLSTQLLSYLAERIGLAASITYDANLSPAPEMNTMLVPQQKSGFITQPYIQTFDERFGFSANLSVIDLLFNEGPNAICILQESGYP